MDPLYYLSLVSTASGVLGGLLITIAMLRRHGRLLVAGAATTTGAAVAAVVAIWPPARWSDWPTVLGIVAGLPLAGVAVCLIAYRHRRALAAVGLCLLGAGLLLSIPAFGERFVAP